MRRAAALICLLVLTGCGEARKPAPQVAHADPPRGFRESTVTGVSFRRPANWGDLEPVPPLAGGVRSKTATVAVWRYPRTEPLPRGAEALAAAETALVERARQRNPTFAVRTSAVKGRGVELTGRQTVAGFTVDVRSLHLFADGTEVVVDAYAPPADFARVDRTVFTPLLASVRIG